MGVTGGFVGPTIFGFTKDATGDFAAGDFRSGGHHGRRRFWQRVLLLAKKATRVGQA